MKIGRRGFFGVAGGAAVGGASAAKTMVGNFAASNAIGGLSQYADKVDQGPPEGMDYITRLQSDIAKRAAIKAMGGSSLLQNFLATWQNDREVVTEDIDCLRSVSASAKRWMLSDRMNERNFENWYEQPSRQLKRELMRRELGTDFGMDF